MKELNIEKQMRDDSDQEAAENAPAQEGQGAAEPSYLDELERLAKLKDDGIITKEEFETKKQQLLGL
jgi:predicted Zn-dependent peptidase